jgi:hypothetical protein
MLAVKEPALMLSKDELQIRRSPGELRAFAECVRSRVRASPSEFALGMTKAGLYKEFIDEILPLSHFAVQAYPSTYSVQPVLGNQGYDAIVYDEFMNEHEKIELTRPHDGAESAADARLVVNEGMGAIKIGHPADDIDAITPFVLDACRKKAIKDYSDCTLVVIVGVEPPYSGFEHVYTEKIACLLKAVSELKFRARRVVLFVPPSQVLPVDG